MFFRFFFSQDQFCFYLESSSGQEPQKIIACVVGGGYYIVRTHTVYIRKACVTVSVYFSLGNDGTQKSKTLHCSPGLQLFYNTLKKQVSCEFSRLPTGRYNHCITPQSRSCGSLLKPSFLFVVNFLFISPKQNTDRLTAVNKTGAPYCSLFAVVVQAMVNGVTIGDFDSYPGSTFNSLDIRGDSVSTLSLKSIGIEDDDWISLVEVSDRHG